MKSYVLLIVLGIGIAIGIAATVYGPDYIEPLLPKAAKSAKGGIQGEVTAKSLEKDRLLVTLNAPEGAILVTFRKKIPEINLLVEEGDTMRLNLREYRLFVDDPVINMLKKPGHGAKEPVKEEPKKVEPVKVEPKKVEPAETGKAPAAEEKAPVSNTAL